MKKKQFNISIRPRRLRENKILRNLVSENIITKNDLIYPLFVRSGRNIKTAIPSMPGVYHFSPDTILLEIPNPNCYRIIYAGLYWGAVNPGSEPINEVRFRGPEGGYFDITGEIVILGSYSIGTAMGFLPYHSRG